MQTVKKCFLFVCLLLQEAAQKAKKAVEQYEAMIAEEAINETKQESQDLRKTVGLELKGHLFDKAILNRLLDMAVDSACEFKVRSSSNSSPQSIHHIWGDTKTQVIGGEC